MDKHDGVHTTNARSSNNIRPPSLCTDSHQTSFPEGADDPSSSVSDLTDPISNNAAKVAFSPTARTQFPAIPHGDGCLVIGKDISITGPRKQDDKSKKLVTNEADSRKKLVTNEADSRKKLVTNEADSRKKLVTNEADSRKKLVTNEADSRKKLVTNVADSLKKRDSKIVRITTSEGVVVAVEKQELLSIPQTNFSIGLLVMCCFNPPFGLLALYFSLKAAAAYRDGNKAKGARCARTSIVISLLGIMLMMVIISSVVLYIAVNKHSARRGQKRMNSASLGF